MSRQNSILMEENKRAVMIDTLPQGAEFHERNQQSKMCFPYKHRYLKTKKVLDLLECRLLFGNEKFVQKHHFKIAKKIARTTFSPPKVLRMADKAEQGGFNISGAGCFRTILRLKTYERGFLFSKSPITKASKDLKGATSEIIPWELIKEENEGE